MSAYTKPGALDKIKAVLLLTKHLDALLPVLVSLRRVPPELPQRLPLLQSLARDIANDAELAQDWYAALSLLSGEPLDGKSVADLLKLSVSALSEGLGDVWGAAFEIGLIDEGALKKWMIWNGLTDGGDEVD
jgi:hypothetical protein